MSNSVQQEDFNFSKIIKKTVENNVKKIESYSYKKLAFLAVSIGVFVAAGISFGNNFNPNIITKYFIDDVNVVNNLNNQVQKLNDQDFDNITQYYKNIYSMYDIKINYLNKIFTDYNLQTKTFDSKIHYTVFENNLKINNEHKLVINKMIEKTTLLKNKSKSKEALSYDEASFILKELDKSKNKIFYQDDNMEEFFVKIIFNSNSAILTYMKEKKIFEQIEIIDSSMNNLFTNIKYNESKDITTKPKI